MEQMSFSEFAKLCIRKDPDMLTGECIKQYYKHMEESGYIVLRRRRLNTQNEDLMLRWFDEDTTAEESFYTASAFYFSSEQAYLMFLLKCL